MQSLIPCKGWCVFLSIYVLPLLFLLSVLTFILLHVHHAGCHDGMVSGLATVGHPGSGCRRPGRMAILRPGRVGDLKC